MTEQQAIRAAEQVCIGVSIDGDPMYADQLETQRELPAGVVDPEEALMRAIFGDDE